MSWELAEKVRARFPDVELFPRPGQEEPHETPPAPAPPTPAAPPAGAATTEAPKAVPRRPAHEAPPAFLTPGVFVPGELLLAICRVLAIDREFGLEYLSFVSAIDRPEANQFEVLYHVYTFDRKDELVLKVRVPRDSPTVPSVTSVWDGANWHEREAFDLFGIVFQGHPNLRRIMMTEDWLGHPLRKDYVYQDPAWLVEAAKQRQKDIEGLELGERA
ncbi:MAG: NADH-quinone oxidoreductase subunit C [bacterium]